MLMLYLKCTAEEQISRFLGVFKQFVKSAIVFKWRGNKKELNFGKSNGFITEEKQLNFGKAKEKTNWSKYEYIPC